MNDVTITVWAGHRKFVYHPDASDSSNGCLSVRVGDTVTVWPFTSITRYTLTGLPMTAPKDTPDEQ